MPEPDRTYENFILVNTTKYGPLRFYVDPDENGHPRWIEDHAKDVVKFLEPIKDWLMQQWGQDVDNDSDPTEGDDGFTPGAAIGLIRWQYEQARQAAAMHEEIQMVARENAAEARKIRDALKQTIQLLDAEDHESEPNR